MYRKAFNCMGMTPREYLLRFALPLLAMGILFPVILLTLTPDLLTGSIKLIIFSIPLVFLLLIGMYPLSVLEAKRNQIDLNMHYYVTHMGVLATSNMSRKDILRRLSRHEAYGYLAEETGRIYSLIHHWNLSLADACRFIARQTPSTLFADFLDRFAHSVEAGEPFEKFIWTEQKVVMNDFDTMYKKSLNSIAMMKETFVSMVMAVIFLASFALIMPIITGIDASMLLFGSVILFLGTEVLLLYFMKMKAPKDKIWHSLPIETKADTRIKISFPVSILASMTVSILLYLTDTGLPLTVMIALSLTPFAFTGYLAKQEEETVKRKDDNFASFIRSLGATSGARGGLVKESLRNLQAHDFGPLTQDIRNLYRRLETRINKIASWKYFAAGTGSSLIERFGAIFAEGTDVGGRPEVIGESIADNFMHIVSLRKLRYSHAGSLRGEMFGLTGGIALTMFLTLTITKMLIEIFTGLNLTSGSIVDMEQLAKIDVEVLKLVLMVMMVGHAFISSLTVRVVDGGSFFNTYFDFVANTWMAAIAAEVSIRMLGPVIGIGGG